MLESDAQVVWNAFYGRNVVIDVNFGSSSCKLLSRPDPFERRVESKRRTSGDLLWKSLGHHLWHTVGQPWCSGGLQTVRVYSLWWVMYTLVAMYSRVAIWVSCMCTLTKMSPANWVTVIFNSNFLKLWNYITLAFEGNLFIYVWYACAHVHVKRLVVLVRSRWCISTCN